ncbi:MAG: S8 family serine peptidase, partial [Bacteroidales bacterium]
MIKRLLIFVCLALVFTSLLEAQDRYWVVFKDKKDVSFDPYEYFDARTIEKRIKNGIPLVQYTDIPLNEGYCSSIEKYSTIYSKSRWLNAVSAELYPGHKARIEKLDFVAELRKMSSTASVGSKMDLLNDSLRMKHLQRQTGIMGGDLFRKEGINGQGIRIAVFDGGFPEVDSLEIFKHLFENNQIIATYDFVNEDEYVYDYNSHGTSVLACIAGYLDGKYYGLAPGAEFLLARTEVNTEIFAEEEYWAAAMEWADKNGADIISSSLGYTYHRYFHCFPCRHWLH